MSGGLALLSVLEGKAHKRDDAEDGQNNIYTKKHSVNCLCSDTTCNWVSLSLIDKKEQYFREESCGSCGKAQNDTCPDSKDLASSWNCF